MPTDWRVLYASVARDRPMHPEAELASLTGIRTLRTPNTNKRRRVSGKQIKALIDLFEPGDFTHRQRRDPKKSTTDLPVAS